MAKFREKLLKVKAKYESDKMQLNLFEDKSSIDYNFRFAEKIPYRFRYKFKTEDNIDRKLMIEDWEIGELYRKCLKRYNNNTQEAIQDVKNKYIGLARNNDIHLFIGTSFEWQKRNSPDPYLIIGVFYPPKPKEDKQQMTLDF